MGRLRINNVGDPSGSVNPITIASATATSCSWTSSPANMPTKPFAWPEFLPLTVEPGTTNEEVLWVIGWAPGATTAPILRKPPGEPNAGTPIAHAGTAWAHTMTQHDLKSAPTRIASANYLT